MLELKERFPKDQSSRLKVAKTVVAFANGQGGRAVIGVDDDGVVIGVDDPDALAVALNDYLRTMISPGLDFRVTEATLDELVVLVIDVPTGPDRPYGVVQAGGAVWQPYVRRNGSTFLADRQEIVNLSTRPAAPGPFGFGPVGG
jgi:predicted HTH transcriptional regulator